MKDYIEETATVADLDKSRKLKFIYKFCEILSFILAIAMFVFSPISIKIEDGEAVLPTGGLLIINIVAVVFSVGIFILLYIFFRKKGEKTMIEYDYYFSEDKIVISKVLNRELRKFCIKTFTGNIYKIGLVNSDTFNKIKNSPDVKIGNYLANKTPLDGKNFYYLAVKDAYGHSLLTLECTEDFMVAVVKKTTKSVLEEGFKIDILR